jgi:hypothetical protein
MSRAIRQPATPLSEKAQPPPAPFNCELLLLPLEIDPPSERGEIELEGDWQTPKHSGRNFWQGATRRVLNHLLGKGVTVDVDLLADVALLAVYRASSPHRRFSARASKAFRASFLDKVKLIAHYLVVEHNYFMDIHLAVLAQQEEEERRQSIVSNSA